METGKALRHKSSRYNFPLTGAFHSAWGRISMLTRVTRRLLWRGEFLVKWEWFASHGALCRNTSGGTHQVAPGWRTLGRQMEHRWLVRPREGSANSGNASKGCQTLSLPYLKDVIDLSIHGDRPFQELENGSRFWEASINLGTRRTEPREPAIRKKSDRRAVMSGSSHVEALTMDSPNNR